MLVLKAANLAVSPGILALGTICPLGGSPGYLEEPRVGTVASNPS